MPVGASGSPSRELNEKVVFKERLMSQAESGSLFHVACGERDIDQGGVLREGESDSFRNEQQKISYFKSGRPNMELKPLSPEFNELRSVIISSNLTSCYLVLEVLKSGENETLNYEKFKHHWIDLYKSIYDIVSEMKPRKSSRKTIR
jgi:hypothetical protein